MMSQRKQQYFAKARDSGGDRSGGSSSTSMLSYPSQSLQEAAEMFRQSWLQSASRQGSWAHRVHTMHLSKPPKIRVINQLPNPHDSPMQPGSTRGASVEFSQSVETLQGVKVAQPQSSTGLCQLDSSQSQSSKEICDYSANQSQPSTKFNQSESSQSQSSKEFCNVGPSQSQPSATLNQSDLSQLHSSKESYNFSTSQSQPSTTINQTDFSQSQSSKDFCNFDASQSQPFIASNQSNSGQSDLSKELRQSSSKQLKNFSQEEKSTIQPNDPMKRSTYSTEANIASKKPRIQEELALSDANSLADEALPSQNLFQCDVCSLCRVSSQEMRLHLTASGHTSASECLRQPDVATVQSVLSPRCIRRPSDGQGDNNADLEVLCPDCALPIGCRFACGLHYSLEHRTGREMWAARPIVHRRRLVIGTSQHVCRGPACTGSSSGSRSSGAHFASASKLHKHWHENPTCCPVSDALANLAPMRLLMTVACPACQRIFLSRIESGTDRCLADAVGPFVAARSHLIERHPTHPAPANLCVTLIDLAGGRVSQVPPVVFNRNKLTVDARDWSIRLARQLVACLRRLINSRRSPTLRRLRRHIRALRNCRQGAAGVNYYGNDNADVDLDETDSAEAEVELSSDSLFA